MNSVELEVNLTSKSSDTDSKSILNFDLISLVIITSSIISEALFDNLLSKLHLILFESLLNPDS
ncbi:3499_t:CDS:2 [Funneliformis caledonium]|uniref:3499_t:CDS:1 n=1 Tax=Funneliformis caledonium TaxID=1117310 RepID=A0A9N9HIF7_9GLOM|nr:3499_t:CDS:2 [Funneliformis caledonium]